MLTLSQLYQRTNKRRKESARYVKIIHQKRGWDSLGRGYVACASYSTHEWSPWKQKFVPNPRRKNRYVTVIVFLDPRLHVVVSCSCADFKFRWEVSLNHAQAAEIEYSNGELPKIRNPTMKKWMCKHLLKLYETIKPELPKAKRHDTTAPIKPPQVQVPPSILRQQAEERRRKELEKLRVKPVAPTKVRAPAKPSRKQSTVPRSLQQPKPTPPAKVKPTQTKVKAPQPKTTTTKRGRSPEMTNWMFNTPPKTTTKTRSPVGRSNPEMRNWMFNK
jgi:hypothetical protein